MNRQKNSPKVSVIVPVYNVAPWLSKCLAGILAQTLSDIEIICVDDGSTDESGSILEEYAKKDARMKVFHRENAGYGAAMNAGLSAASGEYIGIVESDDYILPEMYEELYRAATENDLDFVKSEAYYWMESIGYLKRIHYGRRNADFDKVLGDMERNRFFDFYMNIWTGIYKRSFLSEHEIFFHETPGASYQDNGFYMQTLLYAKRAMWLNRAFYYYRQDNPAASVKSPGKIMAMTKEYEYLAELLKSRGQEELLSWCHYMRMLRHWGTFYRIVDECKREFCNHIKSDYLKYMGYVRHHAYLDGWLYRVSVNPDEFCETVIEKKRGIKERIQQAEKLIIYGAGRRGDMIFRALYNEGYYDKIACFAVSANLSEERPSAQEVLLIADAVEQYPDALVVIAVIKGTGAYLQMTEKLRTLNVTEWLDGTDIEQNFYIL